MRALALCLALIWATVAQAQDDAPPAVLIADRVSVTADGTLIAEGSVEAFQGSQKIQARRITFDRSTGRLQIDGPIRLVDGQSVTILASAAELDEGMQNGLLRGARMVLDQHVQLSALELRRSGGRYSQLYKTVVTSCRVCAEGEAPLWQIRARRVVHDQQEKQLYFEDAQLRVMDVPVFYLPYLRLPDPTLKRATGFLIPTFRSTSQLGLGIKVPYFFRLGDHADITVTPYLSPKTRTLELRYRHAFERGRIAFEGAFTRDDLLPGTSRGYLFGAGAFALNRGYVLSFDTEWASDNAYFADYGLADVDRLDSEVALTKVTRDTFFRTALIHYQTLRDGEDESLLPTIVADMSYLRRYHPARLGGEMRFEFAAHTHRRRSDLDILGRDVTRATADLNWRRDWTLASGIRADWRIGLAADLFDIRQDSGFPDTAKRVTPYAALTLRLPMTRSIGQSTHFLEPIVQLGWSRVSGDSVPNDESGRVEFDPGNLLSLSRFPAPDAREHGPALAYGVNWARYGTGWQGALTVGQVIRENDAIGFSGTSGLSGQISDILLAGQLRTDFGLDLTARTIFDDSLDVSKAELRGGWTGKRAALGGTYIFLQADPAEDRLQAVSEFNLDGSYRINRHWTASASWRYDLADTRAATAGLGLTWRNECAEVDLSINRRYTSSTSIEPSTDFGFTIALRGFSANSGTERYVRSCNS
jgi:LPS-assembly protein